MQSDEDLSKIERLKKFMYSRNSPTTIHFKRTKVHSHDVDVKGNWQEDEKDFDTVDPNEEYGPTKKIKFPMFKILFVFSLLFFIASGGYALYMFSQGGNLISARNLDIQIAGPVNINGGEPLDFDVLIYNKNPIKLEIVDTEIEFPSGTANVQDPSKELQRIQKMVGDIDINAYSKESYRALIFGSEGEKKQIIVKVSYHVKGSNAVLEKEKTYDVYIQSSPVSLTVKSNDEVVSGEDTSLQVEVTSNSKEVLKNILVKAEYPFGFSYKDASIKPYAGNNTWFIGDLPPKSKRTITINGSMVGQDDESRSFRFSVGSRSSKGDANIGTAFLSTEQLMVIKKPFFSAWLTFNGDEAEGGKFITDPGRAVRVGINFKNNLDTPLYNAKLKVKLSGNAFKPQGVTVNDGIYRSGEKTIYWDMNSTTGLNKIDPGNSSKVSFNILPSDSSATLGELLKNPQVIVDVSMSAERTSEDNVPTEISNSVTGSILLTPKAYITTQILRDTGPFKNVGPMPMIVDKETTFTVVWTLNTTSSSIDGAKVEADLPAYVTWLANYKSKDEDLSFDPVTKHLVWNVGEIKSYTGTSGSSRQLYFQLSLKPTPTESGDSPTMIKNIRLTGKDTFTGKDIDNGETDLTTKYSGDKSYTESESRVE